MLTLGVPDSGTHRRDARSAALSAALCRTPRNRRRPERIGSGTVPIELREGAQQLNHKGDDVDPVFPTLKDQEKARDIITNGWDDIVGVKVQCLLPEEYLGPMSFNSSMACEAPIPQ
jgi:putative spermidine/putrescine transport system substrate-binding protein